MYCCGQKHPETGYVCTRKDIDLEEEVEALAEHPVEGGEVEEEGKHPAGTVHLVKHGHRHICR